jgi:hypothetical protein
LFLTTLHASAGRWRGALGIIGIVIIAAMIGQTSIGHTMLQRVGLSAESTGYTSLSFLRPLSLPQSLTARQQEINVSFVINNHANTRQDYQWSLRLLQQGSSRKIDDGQIKLAPERLGIINRSIPISCAAGRVQIVVGLGRPAESIDAWATCGTR